MSSSDMAVTVENVSKMFKLATERRTNLKEVFVRGRSNYDEFWALRDVSVEVPRGSTLGLIGHNGSGKSTLLKLMANIHRPTSGRITHTGRISALLELGAGFHPELTGRENIYLNGSILGMKRKQIASAIERIIEFSGLGTFIDVPVKVYSSGMYARLGFSIAVHLDPEILIVDEILAVGDEEFQRRCFDNLHDLKARGVTIIFVSHSLSLVQKMCDEAIWLDHGEIVGKGNAVEVVDSYISSVNAIESERFGHEPDVAVDDDAAPSQVARRGSGEIKVTGVEFLSDGVAVGAAVSRRPLTVRVKYEAARPIHEPVFALGFYNEQGNKVAGPHTVGHSIGVVAGHGFLDYVLPELPLQQGRWALSVGITDSTYLHVFDHRDKAFELRVQSNGSVVDLGGDVVLPGSWQSSDLLAPHASS